MEQSIREMITEKSILLRDIDALGPNGASVELAFLSSILSKLNKEIADAQSVFNMKRLELVIEHKTAAKAKIYAEASKEWNDWQQRLVQREAVMEMIAACKYYLRGAEAEMRLR